MNNLGEYDFVLDDWQPASGIPVIGKSYRFINYLGLDYVLFMVELPAFCVSARCDPCFFPDARDPYAVMVRRDLNQEIEKALRARSGR